MSEARNLTCIGCPLGCSIEVILNHGHVERVTGNTCPRGEAYAKKEVTNPTRIVTSTVRVTGCSERMVSCKTAEDIPKDKIFDVMDALRDVTVNAPVHIGDVLLTDVANTGVCVIATKNINL